MPGTFTPRFDVANLDQWGCLIKSWATHLDYVSQDFNNQPPRTNWINQTWPDEAGKTPGPATVPDTDTHGASLPWCLPPMTSIEVALADGTKVTLSAVAISSEDFKTRVGAAGVTITSMPDQYTNVIIVQGNVHTMVMRLPPQDTLQSSEDDLLNNNAYPFRSFYAAIYGGPPRPPSDHAGMMQLHANRIGEYTMTNCN